MQPFHAQSIEIGMAAAGASGLLILLAASFRRKPEATAEGWRFPVKFSCLLVHGLAFACGIGLVAFAGGRLLFVGASNWAGWTSFACGFALVLLVLAAWPEPLIFDREGVFERGSASSRIRWEDLSHVREYQIRSDRGVVLHNIYGKQLVVSGTTYASAQLLDVLLRRHPIPFHSLEDEFAPISILQAPVVVPQGVEWGTPRLAVNIPGRPGPLAAETRTELDPLQSEVL